MTAIPIITGEARKEFMHHAYNALFSGKIYGLSDEVRGVMLRNIADDVCTAIRTLPKDQWEAFLSHVTDRIRRPN